MTIFSEILMPREMFEKAGYARFHSALENIAVTLRGLASDVESGQTPPFLPADRHDAAAWAVAGPVAKFVLYGHSRFACCAAARDSDLNDIAAPSADLRYIGTHQEFLETMARDAALVLGMAEAAAGRHRVAAQVLEAADDTGLLSLGTRGTTEAFIHMSGRPQDIIGPLSR